MTYALHDYTSQPTQPTTQPFWSLMQPGSTWGTGNYWWLNPDVLNQPYPFGGTVGSAFSNRLQTDPGLAGMVSQVTSGLNQQTTNSQLDAFNKLLATIFSGGYGSGSGGATGPTAGQVDLLQRKLNEQVTGTVNDLAGLNLQRQGIALGRESSNLDIGKALLGLQSTINAEQGRQKDLSLNYGQNVRDLNYNATARGAMNTQGAISGRTTLADQVWNALTMSNQAVDTAKADYGIQHNAYDLQNRQYDLQGQQYNLQQSTLIQQLNDLMASYKDYPGYNLTAPKLPF